GPFVVVDCAAVPEGLLEAELFGARAGAFTDLRLDRAGMLAAAVGGTVLIDEVARLPVTAQGKLLRVIAEGKRRPLGAEAEEPVDARFLFSSSAGPEAEVREGRLRRDLFHRISVLRVRVPPLRERPEDIPRLVEEVLAAGEGPPPVLGEGVLDRLASLPWPGNVRELHNLIARLRLERSRRITVEDLERHFPAAAAPPVFPRHLLERGQLPELKASLERDYILVHLERLQGDTTALSRFLGIGRLQLYRRCHRLGIRLRGRKAGKGARP
ncbi:MAG: sigma-54-dependent Fis family transcriptional regulator, partial [Planctomycetes bacterium]|nr:sigma-54-dependent Fis family transcriptional regulator [Planctomycetota bacterium]